jgi:hypothetical protein
MQTIIIDINYVKQDGKAGKSTAALILNAIPTIYLPAIITV